MDDLLSETGPNGNVNAYVEDDGRVVFLYLANPQEGGFPVRSVWVRNRLAAPAALDVECMRDGEPPLMPAPSCRHPAGAPALDADNLRLVWLPEGDGVALFDGPTLLAAIPPWSGSNGFHGYASEAIRQGPLAWELPGGPDDALGERFAAAERYWQAWNAKPTPWPATQAAQLASHARLAGPQQRYFAIDGDGWPPKGLTWNETATTVTLATVGMALRPQPRIEQYLEDSRPHRRIELGIMLRKPVAEATVMALAKQLSALANLPWERYTWLGQGHSVACDSLKPHGFSAVLLASSSGIGLHIPLPECFGDPVRLLWLVPVTDQERKRAKAGGSQAVLQGIAYPRAFTG
jgi:hypothetical protein